MDMEKTNTIITIGRQFGSAGREIGYKVAKDLGIKLYDKEMLARAWNPSTSLPLQRVFPSYSFQDSKGLSNLSTNQFRKLAGTPPLFFVV